MQSVVSVRNHYIIWAFLAIAIVLFALPQPVLAQSVFETGSQQVAQSTVRTGQWIATAIIVIAGLLMMMGGARGMGVLSGVILGLVLVLAAPRIITWVQSF